MSIQQEEILIKEFTSGTTLTFFSTDLSISPEPNTTLNPSIVELNNLGAPISISTFDGVNLWSINNSNVYESTPNVLNNFITGHSYTRKLDYIVNQSRIDVFKQRFSSEIDLTLGGGTGGTIPSHTEYIFTEYHEIDDFYVNVKINRTHAHLDTLNIYNNLTNSIPTQDATTGVVFGRLVALQNIKDEEGNNIRIPLRNVPVGIFNPSEDYPTSSSVSDNGDRIFLNIKESSDESEYFNIESFNLDKNELLRSGSEFVKIPEQYKYVTKTNEEGEFVIYDAPIGTQIVMFEVDLLKQGLTRDEIALNFFPFPPDEDSNIDQIPNFSFKQFPIDIVPAWGTIQTGYTELNVTVNMDLRKWTTYFFPPVAVNPEKLETSVSRSAANTLKINVRNMAKDGYPISQIKMTTIQNDLDRVLNQQLNWHQEFAEVRNKAEFYKFGTSILKLPANIYDPNAFKTDRDGIPMSNNKNQKGVWISAYQFKMYINEADGVTRKTGAYRQNNNITYSHYDLNYTTQNTLSQTTSQSIGSFPYEKPWSIDYPEKYSIPKKPTQERFSYDKNTNRTVAYNIGSESVYHLEEPAFSDGDLIGRPVDEIDNKIGGGFGVQLAYNTPIPNRIGFTITKDYMYKYESDVSYNEEYSNGFQPSNSNFIFHGTSKVVDGEKYQRLECGYGYFLRPQGWPRVARRVWWNSGEVLYDGDTTYGVGLGGSTTSPGPGIKQPGTYDWLYSNYAHANDIYNLDSQDCALALNRNTIVKNGTLNFYRVINSEPSNLSEVIRFVIPTEVYFSLNDIDRLVKIIIFNRGETSITFTNRFESIVYKNGSIPYYFGSSITLGVGEFIEGSQSQVGIYSGGFGKSAPEMDRSLGWPGWSMPGNKGFNTITNRFDYAAYEFIVVTAPSNYKDDSSVSFAPSTFVLSQSFTASVPNSRPTYKFYSTNTWDNSKIHGITSAVPGIGGRSRPIDSVYIA